MAAIGKAHDIGRRITAIIKDAGMIATISDIRNIKSITTTAVIVIATGMMIKQNRNVQT